MGTKSDYIAKINKIPTISFNKEQKEIAKKIIESTDEKDLDAVYGLITQRVKTGFVFDEAPEVNHNCVALVKEDKKLNITGDGLEPVEHKLIIGENYDALKNLCATYIDKSGKGLIDVIYIDPPYNTEATKQEGNDYKEEIEATKFIYRDKFTRDGWLNMMNERLKLAKRLLSDKGVIFISIDDTEQAYLKVLCDEVFGENNFIATYIKQSKIGGGSDSKFVVKEHEYCLVYAKNINLTDEMFIPHDKEYLKRYKEKDDKGRYFWDTFARPGLKNPIYYDIKAPDGTIIRNGWIHSKDRFEQEYACGDVRIIKKNSSEWSVQFKQYLNENGKKPRSMTMDFGGSIEGKNDIGLLFDDEKIFSYPKSVKYMSSLLKTITKKDIIVLDFFAGSGTTGQAVMELNEEDGGKRQFILVTNNENNIGTDITRERLYRVIKGKGSKGEQLSWQYSKEKPYLSSNNVTVFKIDHTALTLKDLEKAEKIRDIAKAEFKKLNPNCSLNNDFDVYNELAALNPQKGEK